MIFLSFIIPAYNAEKFLLDTLSSIVQEVRKVDFKEIEIVIVNDGSTDSTQLLAEEFIQEHSDLNIKLFSKENGGLSDARNYGVDKANGEYIWFFDADDIIETNVLSKVIPKLKKEDLDFLSLGIRDCYSDGRRVGSNLNNKPTSVVDAITYASKYSIEHSACCYVFKRILITGNNVYFLNGVLSEDYDFTWRLLEKCNKINALGEIAYNYLVRDGSLSRRKNEDFYRFHHTSMIKIFSHTNDYLSRLDNPSYKQALLPYYSQLKIIALITLLKSVVPIKEKLQYFADMKKNDVLNIVKPSVFTWKEFIIMTLVKLNLYSLVLKLVSKS